jgi:glycosyltransferase involved in cell wall biosynthesis
MSTLVLLPTYNERENILELIGQILALPAGVELLVIDDNSPDGTAQAVEQFFGGESRVHLLKRPGKLGLGTAYSAGFQYAIREGYKSVISMDADFSHDPRFIPDLIAAMSKFDMVIGSRYVPGGATVNWGFLRKIISRTANLVAHVILSMKQADCTSGYRLYRSELLETIEYESIIADGYSYLIEILYRASRRGCKIGETAIVFVERRHGQSKISRKEIFKAIKTVLRLRFHPPVKASQAVAKA